MKPGPTGLAVTLALGSIASGCGDPIGPPARPFAAVSAVAPVVSTAPDIAQALASPPTIVDPFADAPVERIVIALRGDPDPDQRRRAIDAYARHVSSDAVSREPLIEAVATDLDPLVRRWAALALVAEPTPDLRPRLRILAASERDPVVRSILERPDVEHAASSAHHRR